MEIVKTFYLCDRCFKEYEEEDLYFVADWARRYQLCKECKLEFKEYEGRVKDLEKQIDELAKEYKFGKYIPRREKQKGEEIY